jgi:hypothetical protein
MTRPLALAYWDPIPAPYPRCRSCSAGAEELILALASPLTLLRWRRGAYSDSAPAVGSCWYSSFSVLRNEAYFT